jgi:hypothetical protein
MWQLMSHFKGLFLQTLLFFCSDTLFLVVSRDYFHSPCIFKILASMNPAFEKIYHSMLSDISQCKKTDERAEIECRFQISQNCLSDLEQEMESFHFSSAAEEIEFYRELKPKFIASIQYYNLVYHAVLFKPAEHSVMKEFWIKEGSRMNKFILENAAYYNYYKSGSTGRDEELFLNATAESKEEKQLFYDEWIGHFLALERYNEYVMKQLATI